MPFVGALLLWLGSQGLTSQASPPAAVRTAQARFATVSGQIRSAADALPVYRARIVLTWSGGAIGPVFTDDKGFFTLQGPANARYTLLVRRAGFAHTTLEHAASAPPTSWDVPLAAAAVITGRVVGSRGTPEAGREVRVRRIEEEPRGRASDVGTTDTDDAGAFRFGALAAGRYEVTLGSLRMTMPAGSGNRVATFVLQDHGTNRGAAVTLTTGEHVDVEMESDLPEALPMPGPFTVVASGNVSLFEQGDDIDDSIPAIATGPRQGAIEGHVLETNGRPVPGAFIRARPIGTGNAAAVYSDRDGAYELGELAAGRYRIVVSKPGFIRWAYGQTDVERAGRTLSLRTNGHIRNIDVSLPPAAVVSGTVLDAFGVPVEGVTLQLLESRTLGGRQQLVPLAGAVTSSDDLGEYRFTGIEPGAYYVGAADDTPTGTPALVEAPGRATFYPGQDSADAAVAVQVDVGLDAPGTDIVFAPGPAARVAGEIVSVNGGAFNGDVTLASNSRHAVTLLASRSTRAHNGQFEFVGVPPGEYVVQALEQTSTFRVESRAVRGGALVSSRVTARADSNVSFGTGFVTVTPTPVDPAPVSIQMSAGRTIHGHLFVEGMEPGGALPGFTLRALPADLDLTPRAGTPLPLVRIQPDDWTFDITNVLGPMRLAVSARADADWWLKRVRVDGVDIGNAPITVNHFAPDDTDIEITVARTAAAISGRIVGANRQAFGGGSVLVFSTNPDDWHEGSRYVRAAEARENGEFTVAGLAPGDYWAVAVDVEPPPARRLSTALLTRLASIARHVALSEGQHRQIDLRPMRLPR